MLSGILPLDRCTALRTIGGRASVVVTDVRAVSPFRSTNHLATATATATAACIFNWPNTAKTHLIPLVQHPLVALYQVRALCLRLACVFKLHETGCSDPYSLQAAS
jgi:hypothetical protein